MIALHTNCLVFQLNNGDSIPCTADMIGVEIVGEAAAALDPDMLRHAAASVFHYFKVDLARETVSINEFSMALEKALRHLGYTIHAQGPTGQTSEASYTDLGVLASENESSLELLFFPRLRDELRVRLRAAPRVLRFRGLRGCVKQLTGARRWTNRCEQLQDQIVSYLRSCLDAETESHGCAMVVE